MVSCMLAGLGLFGFPGKKGKNRKDPRNQGPFFLGFRIKGRTPRRLLLGEEAEVVGGGVPVAAGPGARLRAHLPVAPRPLRRILGFSRVLGGGELRGVWVWFSFGGKSPEDVGRRVFP